MPKGSIFQIPNLVSLSRIFLTPFVAYFLWKGDMPSTHICALLLILAGITDGLDGYLARKLNQISDLGKTLDPLADKIMAGILVILLILFRDFPVWLAAVIIGRDLLIMIAGLILLQGKKIVVPSNLTGKYAFCAIAFLIGSYIYNFTFGIWFTTYITLLYISLSIFFYTRVFVYIKKGLNPPIFKDKPLYKILRWICVDLFIAIYFYKFYVFMVGG
jgi:CDP-diacylglycerol--glycerol-3-phosphate 3-phosphatidyltransferase